MIKIIYIIYIYLESSLEKYKLSESDHLDYHYDGSLFTTRASGVKNDSPTGWKGSPKERVKRVARNTQAREGHKRGRRREDGRGDGLIKNKKTDRSHASSAQKSCACASDFFFRRDFPANKLRLL